MKKIFLIFFLVAFFFTSCVTYNSSWFLPGSTQVMHGEPLRGAVQFIGVVAPMILSEYITGNGFVNEDNFANTALAFTSLGFIAWSIVDGESMIFFKELSIGISEDELKYCRLGYPIKINESFGSWGLHKQYVYNSFYVYVENGIVVSWQTK